MVMIGWAKLDQYWRIYLGTIRVNITMIKKLRSTTKDNLGLEEWLPLLVPYPLKY